MGMRNPPAAGNVEVLSTPSASVNVRMFSTGRQGHGRRRGRQYSGETYNSLHVHEEGEEEEADERGGGGRGE
jgi:hypothetical protein